MKSKSILKHAAAAFGLVLAMASCKDKVVETYTYTVNNPIYMSHDEFANKVLNSEPRSLSNPGKIHIKGDMLFIVEQYEGIHVIDNTNPSSPQTLSFIEIPGVVDVASRGYTLYVDSYTDLVALDISDRNAIKEIGREAGVFTQNNNFFNSLPPTNNQYPIGPIDPALGVVIGWKVETITEEYLYENYRGGCWNCMYTTDVAVNDVASESTNSPTSSPIAGISGSMARFAVKDNALYVLDLMALKVFDISTAANPVAGQTFASGLMVETLFPMNDMLFVGTTSGMQIYDITARMTPAFITTFAHATSCDPVVVEGNIAYVTLRSGTECQGFTNQLEAINVADIKNPSLIKAYPMTNPHGLGIDNGTLFICDGDAGLKIYDAADPATISDHQLSHFDNINAYDVIPLGNVLLMIGSDGFYQYDYSDLQNIQLLSVIPVN